MRKILAILLLVVFGLPTAMPLFAAGQDDAGMPACCRRAGKHHCGMTSATEMPAATGSAKTDVRTVGAAGDVCPYRCALMTRSHAENSLLAPVALRAIAATVSHAAVQAQAESRWRVARERSRGKRGPPDRGAQRS